MKQTTNAHKGVREFYLLLLGGTQTEQGWEPLLSMIDFFALDNFCELIIKAMRFGNSFGFSSNFAKMYRLSRK